MFLVSDILNLELVVPLGTLVLQFTIPAQRTRQFATLYRSFAKNFALSRGVLGRCRGSFTTRGDMAGSAVKLSCPLAGGSPGLRPVFALKIERHCGADEILQCRLIDLVTFIDVDGAPHIPIEAGIK